MLSVIDLPDDITSSTIIAVPLGWQPTNIPDSPWVLASLRLWQKGLLTELSKYNVWLIDEARVIPLYAGPKIKSYFIAFSINEAYKP